MGTTGRRFRFLFPALVLGLFLSGGVVSAQQYADTFYVTVAEKTPEHPYYGVGYSEGYVVNGRQSPTITLVRDSLYLFNTDSVPSRLTMQFYTIAMGGTQGFYSDHIIEHQVSKGLWKIKATDETPDTLYYASTRQLWVGGMILIVDSLTSSVEEDVSRAAVGTFAEVRVYPNPFAEAADLHLVLADRSRVRVDVVNALGQVVGSQDLGTLEAGERTVRLDGSALSAGLYLYRVQAVSGGGESVATGTMRIVR